MPANWTHGTAGLLLGYGCVAAGVLAGLARAKFTQLIAFPLIAVPALIAAMVLWALVCNTLPLRQDGLFYSLLALAFYVLVGVFAGQFVAGVKTDSNYKRGTRIEPVANRPSGVVRKSTSLTLGGRVVSSLDETKHFKLVGTTGTGKSTAIRELLQGAFERGDRAVIADPDGSYVARFYDPQRDVILNPYDTRAARWHLFGEMQSIFDADQLARSLIADAEGPERMWRDYARVFLSSLLRQLHRVKHDDVGELYTLLSTTPVQDLRDLLNDTPAGPYLAQDNGKFFGAVRAVANTHLNALEHVASQSGTQRLSVREWICAGQGGGGGVLFLPYRANEIATLRGLISAWMRLAIFNTMSQPESDQRLWFVVDELDALGSIDGLKDALARLRKFGGRCVLGFQSIAQVSGTYGHSEAQTIVENCGNTLILRCSSSEGGGTARFASKLIGEREVLRAQITRGRSGANIFAAGHRSVSTSKQQILESAVLASEIEQLPDLQGYLKLASTPSWVRVTLN